jgi:REP element-mobilizing transposase RayT
MPRKARIDAPGALHHIIIRGIERKAIFKDIAVRKLGYKCSDVSKAMGISAVTVSKAANLGSKLSGVGKIQKLILDN